ELQVGRIVKKGKKRVWTEHWTYDEESFNNTGVCELKFCRVCASTEEKEEGKCIKKVKISNIVSALPGIKKLDSKWLLKIDPSSIGKNRIVESEGLYKGEGIATGCVVEPNYDLELLSAQELEQEVFQAISTQLIDNQEKERKDIVLYTDGSLALSNSMNPNGAVMGLGWVQFDE
ncbi:27212_t:CDS:1, partial [Gigaspora margarita]